MSRPRIQITLIDQKGTKGCHRISFPEILPHSLQSSNIFLPLSPQYTTDSGYKEASGPAKMCIRDRYYIQISSFSTTRIISCKASSSSSPSQMISISSRSLIHGPQNRTISTLLVCYMSKDCPSFDVLSLPDSLKRS